MKKLVFLFLVLSFFLTSCEKEDTPGLSVVQRTVFVYMPWSTDLLTYFEKNLDDMEIAIGRGILKNERVLVFLSTTPKKATLFEFQCQNGKCVRNVLKAYENPAFTTAPGITSVLNDVKSYAPANSYSMIIGSHGLGWIPVSSASTRSVGEQRMHWDGQGAYRTRLFGGKTSEYQTDITTFVQGIEDAGLKMEYIMFDDCYMSCVEVAYDLKDVTHYLIGCPTEIMVHGMPYEDMCTYLFGEVDYAGICEVFLDFYKNYEAPYGTIGVTDCSELNELATIMKEINSKYTFDSSLLSSVQIMGGYSPTIFFDFGDYVAKLCPEQDLLNKLETQLAHTVPFKSHTDYFYTTVGIDRSIKINTYSGITISDISTHRYAAKKAETAWYKATH